jgi:hypothetical protein
MFSLGKEEGGGGGGEEEEEKEGEISFFLPCSFGLP